MITLLRVSLTAASSSATREYIDLIVGFATGIEAHTTLRLYHGSLSESNNSDGKITGKNAYQSADNQRCTFLADMLAFGDEVEFLLRALGVGAWKTGFGQYGDQVRPKVTTARIDGETISVRSLDGDGGGSTSCGSIALMSLRYCFSFQFTAAGNIRAIAAFAVFCCVATGEDGGVGWMGGERRRDGKGGEESEGGGEVHVTTGTAVAFGRR